MTRTRAIRDPLRPLADPPPECAKSEKYEKIVCVA